MTDRDDSLPRVETRSRSEQVRESLLHFIRSSGLTPGTQLPTERELAERFGVGRSSIREAMRSLAALNIVEVAPGRGTFVSQLSLDGLPKVVEEKVQPATQVSWQVVEARSVIELAAGRLAAKRHTPEDIEQLQAALQDIETAYTNNDLEAVIVADSAFHLALVKASHNDVLVQTLSSIDPWLARQRRELFQLQMTRDAYGEKSVIATHQVILEHILAGDARQVAETLEGHLQMSWDQVDIWPADEEDA